MQQAERRQSFTLACPLGKPCCCVFSCKLYSRVHACAAALQQLHTHHSHALLCLCAAQAFKRKGETYKIVWPGKAEFVRMAAKFGATIVPFAAIGCDEAVTHHLSAEELEQLQKLLPPLPFRLPWQQREEDAERLRRIPAARVGVNATMEDLEAFGKVGGCVFEHISASLSCMMIAYMQAASTVSAR